LLEQLPTDGDADEAEALGFLTTEDSVVDVRLEELSDESLEEEDATEEETTLDSMEEFFEAEAELEILDDDTTELDPALELVAEMETDRVDDLDDAGKVTADEDPFPAAQPSWTWLNCQPAVLLEKAYQTMEVIALRLAPVNALNGTIMGCVAPVRPETV
jgi:hypothetical protein